MSDAYFDIEVELEDGTVCTWDATQYTSLDDARLNQDLEWIREKEPRAVAITFFRNSREAVHVDRIIEGEPHG